MREDVWTDAEIELLRRLWADRVDARHIGQALRVSKLAVLNKARRLGLPARENPVRPASEQTLHARQVIIEAPPLRRIIFPSFRPDAVLPPVNDGCRWPLWDTGELPTHAYCGAALRDWLAPYCPAHCAIAFVQRVSNELASPGAA